MRPITTHHGDPLNDVIEITPLGPPQHGDAPCRYHVRIPIKTASYSPVQTARLMRIHEDVRFQDGPLDGGVNGLTEAAYLAIVIDRLGHLQAGEQACHEYGFALDHARDALEALQRRTRRGATTTPPPEV